MDLTQLHYFKTIARSKSLREAGRRLGVSQPGLTVVVRKLEEELGTTLVHRRRTGISLTASGERLVGYAEQILQLAQEAREQVQDVETSDAGVFRLGCAPALGETILPRVLRSVRSRYPRVELEIYNARSTEVRRALLARDIHFGFLANPIAADDLVMVEVFRDTTELYLQSQLRSALGGDKPGWTARAALEAATPHVVTDNVPTFEALTHGLAQVGHLTSERIVCGDLRLTLRLCGAGLGVAILPRMLVRSSGFDLIPLHADLPKVYDRVVFAYRADLHRTRAAKGVKDLLVASAREQASTDGALADGRERQM